MIEHRVVKLGGEPVQYCVQFRNSLRRWCSMCFCRDAKGRLKASFGYDEAPGDYVFLFGSREEAEGFVSEYLHNFRTEVR